MNQFVFLFTAGLVLQASAFTSLESYRVPPLGLVEPLLLHAAASLLFALAVRSIHMRRNRAHGAGVALFIGVTNAFLPVIAPLGWLLAVWPAMRRGDSRSSAERSSCKRHAPVSGDHAPRKTELPSLPGEPRDLWGILMHASCPLQRQEALTRTLYLEEPTAAAMLRFALRDTEDEVRLLAFALLTERELTHAQRIRESHEAARTHRTSREGHESNRAASEAYWQLALLAGGSSQAAKPLYRRALEHCYEALAGCQPNSALQLFAARIHLELGEITQAAWCVTAAQKLGDESDGCHALRAEVEFRSRRLPSQGVLA